MRVDLTPLLGNERGETIRLAGVRVGDRAAKVDRRALTGAHPDQLREQQEIRNGNPYRTSPDGAPREVPLAELVEAVLARGGYLYCGDLLLRVTGGAIERFVVRGPSLASLRIAREEDIAAHFGLAAGHNYAFGCRLHHYPDRGLVLAWAQEANRFDHVALGPVRIDQLRLGARELLSELLRAFPLLESPAFPVPAGGSARVRHQRVTALSRALGLGPLADLSQGRFLQGGVSPARRAVLEEVAARGPYLDEPVTERSADYLFAELLRYRDSVERVVRATAGWLTCGDPVLLGMVWTQNSLGSRLEAMMTDIDRWLTTLMDPAHRTFELRDLIENHAWPDVDLDALENDEL